MKLLVVSREEIESGLRVASPYAVVSVRNAGATEALVRRQAGLLEVLFLEFDDAEPSANFELPPHIRLMTAEDARAVWHFVEKHQKRAKTLVVQCEQGMSRSPAIAAAIAEQLGLDAARFSREYAPNQFVLRLMKETSAAAR